MIQATLTILQTHSPPDGNDVPDSTRRDVGIVDTRDEARRQRRASELLSELLRIGFDNEMHETPTGTGCRIPVLLLKVNWSPAAVAHDAHPLVQRILRRRDFALDLARTPESAVTGCDGTITARERSVLQLIGRGLSNKKIARDLKIAPETVKSHTKHIFCKLGTNTRAQAVAHAAKWGLL